VSENDLEKVARYEQFIRERIAELRADEGLKRNELSYLIDHGKTYVANVENNTSQPSVHALLCILVCLDKTPSQFFAPADPDEETSPMQREWMESFVRLDEDAQRDILRIAKKLEKTK